MNGFRFSFLLAALATWSWGCAAPTVQRVNRAAFSSVSAETDQQPGLAITLASLRSARVGPGYLGPGDLIRINIFNPSDPAAKQEYELRASPAGEINVPQVGRVKVVAKTASELEKDLSWLFQKFIREPIVTVTPVYATRAVTVMGAVAHPGVQELPRYRSTVLDALMSVGGPTDRAGDSVIVIRAFAAHLRPAGGPGREGNPTSEAVPGRISIDLDRLISGDLDLNVELQEGDFVWVPEVAPRYLYIHGYVRQPRRYELRRNEQVSVMQALAMAGGPTFLASTGNVTITRGFGSGEEKATKVNLAKIAEGKQPNVMLGAGDSLVVGSSVSRQMLWFVRGILSLGVGFRYDYYAR